MTPELLHRIEEKFHELMPLDGEHRSAALSALEDSDSVLASHVRRLFEAECGDSFLEPPQRMVPGRRIGEYELVRVIGSGGMGTVYEARQGRPARTVALKVLRAGLASPDSLTRFELESQILAALRHPGIAQIFDAGVHEDAGGTVPYFVMEFIEDAQPLTAFVRDRGLNTAEILALFCKVCDAVGHAHQRGVIHRDLKPGNILVDGSGQVKVIDFGVARVTLTGGSAAPATPTPRSLQTLGGQLVGTPDYMSPEQYSAGAIAIDTRADVYALGVVLYELLGGRTPHNLGHANVADAMMAVRDNPITPLSRLNPSTRGDLETIVTRALEKSPSRRYQSVGEFARDIERFVAREPIDARPPSVVYQLTRFAQRNRSLVASATLALTAMIAATAISTVFAVRAGADRDRAKRAAEFMQGALGSANPFLPVTMTPEIRSSPLDPWAEWAQSPWPFSGKDGRAADSLDVLCAAADRLPTDFADDPETRAGLAEFIGWTLLRLEDPHRPPVLLRDAYETNLRLFGKSDERTIRAALRLAECCDYYGPVPDGTALYRFAAVECDRKYGPLHAKSLRVQRMLANHLLSHRGEWQAADSLLAERLSLDSSEADRTDVLLHAAYRAVIQSGAAAAEQADRVLTEAEQEMDGIRLAQARVWCAQALGGAGAQPERAETALRLAAATYEEFFGFRTMAATGVREELGRALNRLHRTDEAVAIQEEVTSTYEQLQGEHSWEAASSRLTLARSLWSRGTDDAQVAALAERCIQEFRTASGSRTGGYIEAALYLNLDALSRMKLFHQANAACDDYQRELWLEPVRAISVLRGIGAAQIRSAELLAESGDLDRASELLDGADLFLALQRWDTGSLRAQTARTKAKYGLR